MENRLLELMNENVQALRASDAFRKTTPWDAFEGVRIRKNGVEMIDFSSNDYLGLSFHPHVIDCAQRWTAAYGTGCRASRLMSGTLQAVADLEARLARWKKCEAALILGSGYMTNIGVLRAFALKHAVFFCDKLNHASLNTGAQNEQTELKRYRHSDMAHLENQLANTPEEALKIIVSDTVFSMDGDIAPLDELRRLARQYGAMLYLDDAHATGILGENGKGLGGIGEANEIAMGTCSKAFGAYGAYVCGTEALRDYLVNRCGAAIFSTALPPGVYGAIEGALDVFASEEGAHLRQYVMQSAQTVATALRETGYDVPETQTPIIPILLGENETALRFAQACRENGLTVCAVRPPTVPVHTARIRLTLSAAHTPEMIDRMLGVMKKLRKNV